MDYEEYLEAAGGFGFSQFFISMIITFSIMTKSWIVFGLPFLGKMPEYSCKVLD